jgi:cytochrome c oxidase subunit II
MSIDLHVGRASIAGALLALVSMTASVVATAGDPARGQTFYAVCSTCHGPSGEGMKEMNAPALAGREEWYLVRQIQNFRDGIRGGHPDDVYGRQMAPMAAILPDVQAIEDVAAYLHSLAE